jgi:hypothetical protein
LVEGCRAGGVACYGEEEVVVVWGCGEGAVGKG